MSSAMPIVDQVGTLGESKSTTLTNQAGKRGSWIVALVSATFGAWATACLVGGVLSCNSSLKDIFLMMLTGSM